MASKAPTLGGTKVSAPTQTSTPQQVIPFTRASRKKSRLVTQTVTTTLNATVQALSAIQLPASGFFRKLKLSIIGTTVGNIVGAVAFNNDAPFNAITQLSMLSPNGDTLINVIDGFTLYVLNKYGAFSTGRRDPLANPSYSAITGGGATAGSFAFEVDVPVEVDARDAFTALQNMAGNQSYLLNLSLNNLATIYSTAPTNAPTVTITITMEYWSAPAPFSPDGIMQASFPMGNGSVSLIQTQTPNITASSQQNIQLLNVGNTIRFAILILRTGAGVRTETDFPAVSNWYVNNDAWFYKVKSQWRKQMADEYQLTGGLSATPALNTIDNGVYVLTDFMNDGASGDGKVDGASNRDLWLVTLSSTAFNYEAVSWGAGAGQLLVVQNVIRPISAQAMYAPMFI